MPQERRGVLSRMTGIRRLVAIVLIGAMSPFAFGCYGAFPLTHIIYNLNGEVKPGLLSQIVFWVFVILPVYSIAMVADAVVLNLVEFWTGEKIDVSTAVGENGASYVLTPSADGSEAVLTVSRDGQIRSEVRFVRLRSGLVEVRDADGRLAGQVVPDGAGGFRLTDAAGATVSTISAADLPSLAALGGR